MSEQQKTIDALWPVAHAAASHIKSWHLWTKGADHKQFGDAAAGGWDGSKYIAAAFAKPGEIEYRLKGGAEVRIKGIDVSGVSPDDIYVGPIEPTGDQRVVKAEIIGNRNETLNDVGWKLTHRDLTSETMADKVAREVGASMSAGLRQQVGYGSEMAGIQGETEVTLNIEASIKAAWEREMTAHRESEVTGERDIIIRAMHRGVLERVETVGPAKQVIRAKGALKFGIWLHAPGHFWAEWDSMNDFCAVLQGIDAKRSFSSGDWIHFYRKYPVPSELLAPFRQTIHAESEKVREFEEASNVDVVIRSDPLNDDAKLQDALRLVALQAKSKALRKMADAALTDTEEPPELDPYTND